MKPIDFKIFTPTVFLFTMLLTFGCTSTTLITSNVPDAEVYIKRKYVGTTPYSYSSNKVSGSETKLRLKKEGYETLDTIFIRNEEVDKGNIGVSTFLVVPLFFTKKYKDEHHYILKPKAGIQIPLKPDEVTRPISNKAESMEKVELKTKAERISELIQQKENGEISQEEFDLKKQQILEEPEQEKHTY